MVRMVGQVVSYECVEEVIVTTKMSGCQGDKLPVAACPRMPGRPREDLWVSGDEGCGYKYRRRVGRDGALQHLTGRLGIAADQPVEEHGVVGHGKTVTAGADDPLTTPDERQSKP